MCGFFFLHLANVCNKFQNSFKIKIYLLTWIFEKKEKKTWKKRKKRHFKRNQNVKRIEIDNESKLKRESRKAKNKKRKKYI